MTNEPIIDSWLSLKLGETDLEIELETRADNCHAVDLMVKQAVGFIEIYTRDLDAPVYDRNEFLEAINQLCIRNRKARVRVLVQNPSSAIRNFHRFIELARKLSSSIEVRHVHDDYLHYNEAFLIVDTCGLIHRKLSDRYEGIANFNTPVEARRLSDYFTEVWERSDPPPDFQRLHI